LGTARPTFDQSLSPNTAGFVYSDITSSGNKLNSKFSFNGLNIQKSSNTFDDLVDGVTFNLKSITEAGGNDTNISVDVDSESIKTDLKDFVDKFNSLYTYLKQKQVSTKETRGILIGDANAQSLLYSLQNSAVNSVPGINTGNLQYLSQIGISFDSTNGLSISDENLLSQKIKGSRSEVEALFNSTSGIAKTLYNSFENYIGAAGYLTNSINSISDNINYINDRIDTVQSRIDNRTEALRNQYFELQTQLASLINSQNFFSSGISNIFG
jgi:flagellar hook-associated protein 2